MKTEELVAERGKTYGSPLQSFEAIREIESILIDINIVDSYTAHDKTKALMHAIYMIVVKLVRLASCPAHKDSWDDIQGYAECAKMILKEAD